MGMYTSVDLRIKLKANLPAVLRETFYTVVEHCQLDDEDPANHEAIEAFYKDKYERLDALQARLIENPAFKEFFSDERWSFIFNGGDGARKAKPEFKIQGRHYLLVVSGGLKNYDSTIEKFGELLTPYLAHRPGDLLGETFYEGSDHWSAVIVKHVGKFKQLHKSAENLSYCTCAFIFGETFKPSADDELDKIRRYGPRRERAWLRRQQHPRWSSENIRVALGHRSVAFYTNAT